MKKISILSVFAVLVMPAFAEENSAPVVSNDVVADGAVVEKNESDVVAQYSKQFETPRADNTETVSNPKIRFPHGMQLGAGVAPTSGLNGFIGYNNKNFDSFWAKRLGIRFDWASTKPVKSFINKGIDKFMGDDGIEINDEISIVDGAIKAQHMGALVDFYPFGDTWFLGGWRLSGGYMFGNLDINAKLQGTVDGLPSGTIEFEFDGTNYRYLGNDVYGKATAKWKFHGPYVGTGFDIGLFAGLKIFMDAGVVFTNKAAELNLDVDVNNLQYKDGDTWKNFAGDPNYNNLVADFNARKDAELQDAQDELDKYKFYPMVKMGLMYRF